MPGVSRQPFVWSCVFYTTLACLLTYPLVRHLTSVMPHDLGDPLMSTTIMWWNAHTLPLTARWWDGFAFYPATGMLAFSDHRLGESLLATPLQWAGASPVTAYNLTLLATFPLCALAAHWLAFTLTARHDASLLCGLAYGFCPYRFAHLQHLELLAGVGMPAALAALHRYRQSRSPIWLFWFALALVVQGLCTSYYLLFFTVLLAVWTLWFVGWRDARPLAAIAIATAGATVALLPVIAGYERVHTWYGLQRSFDDIRRLSADVTALGVASPLMALWGWTAKWTRSEGELFPGLTIVALAVSGSALAWIRARPRGSRTDRWAMLSLTASAPLLALALAGWFAAPWRIDLPGIHASSDSPFKPFSLALAAAAFALARSGRARDAFARKAPLAFYAMATALLFLCSLGPKPALNGHQILYEPVYAWLMALPPFGSVRVPARFAMPMMLTLSLTGALALGHLCLSSRGRRALVAALACGMVAEAWTLPLPLPALPDRWPAARAADFAAVLELPLGDVFDDAAAMYRATGHGRPLVNGSSGFEPTHYFTLRTALEEHDPAAFDGFPSGRPLLVVVDRRKDPQDAWRAYLASLPNVTALGAEGPWAFYAAAPRTQPSACQGIPAPIAGIAMDDPPDEAGALTDEDPRTWWTTSHAQRAGDAVVLDLGTAVRPCAVVVSVGEFRKSYPRKLAIETSLTGDRWTTVAETRTAGLTMRGALVNPKMVSIEIPLADSAGRYIRLRVAESHPTVAWMVTDVAVRVAAPEE